MPLATRFRGFLPVVIDVETGGFNAQTDGLLEIAAVLLEQNDQGFWEPGTLITDKIKPFPGAIVTPEALKFNGLNLADLEAKGKSEKDALQAIFTPIRERLKAESCTRAILTGHNAHFDLGFVHAAALRAKIKRNPFHPFSCFDTVSLSALALGETVLSKACQIADIEFNPLEAHSAAYDAQKTAELFCTIVNDWQQLKALRIAREAFTD